MLFEYNTYIINREVCKLYTITSDSLLMEVLENAPQTAPFFNAIGMHCLSCVLATDETIEQACAAHGFDVDDFIVQVNAFLEQQEAQKA